MSARYVQNSSRSSKAWRRAAWAASSMTTAIQGCAARVSSNASMRVITLGQFRRRSAADIVRSLKSPRSNSVKTATQMLRGEVPRARRCRVAFAIRWRPLKRDPWQAASPRTYRIFHHLRAISVHLNGWYRPLAQALVQFGEQVSGWCAAKCRAWRHPVAFAIQCRRGTNASLAA